MRYLFLILVCLFLLQSCDTTEPPKEEEQVVPSPELTIPSDDSTGVLVAPTLKWKAVSGATQYFVQISTQSDFMTIEDSATVNFAEYQMESLNENVTYYWHVRAIKQGTASEWSETWSFSSGNFNTRVAVGTRLHFEQVNMETQEKDTMLMRIEEQGIAFGGKSNVARISVTFEGSSQDIYMNYEPNGNISFFDDEWREVPVGTRQDRDYGLDTVEVSDDVIVVEHLTTKYDGAATAIINGVTYSFHMATVQLQRMEFGATDGVLQDITTTRTIFSFSPKLGFLIGVEDYYVSDTESLFGKSSLFKIEI